MNAMREVLEWNPKHDQVEVIVMFSGCLNGIKNIV